MTTQFPQGTPGTALFHTLNTDRFGRLDTRIGDLQTRIAAGTNDPRPSVDLARAARLSAADEQQAQLTRHAGAVARASDRLGQTDSALAEVSLVVQRMGEIAIRGASASTPPAERATLGTELAELRRVLIDHANARDSTGRPLFAGTRTSTDPFVDTAAGVVYQGDGARPRLRVSENARIDTGLSGAELFQSVPDATGARRDLFGMIDDLARSLGAADVAAAAERVEGAGTLAFTPDLTRAAASWQMTVTGPAGSAGVAAELVAGAPGPLIDAINAASAQTGVTAAAGPDGAVLLQAAGPVALSGLAVDPPRGGVLAQADGQPMIAEGRSAAALVAGLRAAADHVADARAEVGALGAVAERQGALIERRQTALAGVLAGIEDLDIAEAVTRLQELMLTKQVSQQTYARIAQASLFDWLR